MPIFDTITAKKPIDRGWSGDKKYHVTTAAGENYLLRITPQAKSTACYAMYNRMEQVAALGVPMCRPIEFGSCEEGVYILQDWIEGEDAEAVLPTLSDTEQYVFGLEAGKILNRIHSISAPPEQEDWAIRFNRKIDRKIKLYNDCPIQCENGQALIDYIEANRGLLKNRPQCFQHGDYHIGNMMIDQIGQLQIIDFDRFDFGDPWEEFNRIVWCAQRSPLFASGMVNGYFDGKVPMDFWRLLALYIASNTLSSIPWAIPYGQAEIDTMISQARDVLTWYDTMRNPVPCWYFSGYYLQTVDEISYKLKSAFDFTFLRKYGKVFKVFDDQDSGNICFGLQTDRERLFVKFAGAPTEQYDGSPADAIARLKATVPVYQDLSHPNLIEYLGSEEIGGGFAVIFRWADGDCMGRQYPASRRRFLQTDPTMRLSIFRAIASFFAHMAEAGYVAIDFYDGSILYDFIREQTTVCDCDFFRKMPYINDMGRLWGSSRFMSPEEFTLGAVIDEVTNVYTIGATAFALFSDYNRTPERWTVHPSLYNIALKAVSDAREERQQSIRQFIDEWETALGQQGVNDGN